MATIPGFEPCFFFDFDQEYTFKFKLVCKYVTKDGLVDVNDQSFDHNYLDVLKSPKITPNDLNERKDNLTRIKNNRVKVAIDF